MPKKRDKEELDDDDEMSPDEYENEIYTRYNLRSKKQKTTHEFDSRTSLSSTKYVSSSIIPPLYPSLEVETDIEG